MPKFEYVPALVNTEDLILPAPGADGVMHEYTIKAASARDFLRISVIAEWEPTSITSSRDQALIADLDSQDSVYRTVIGSETFDQIIADGVSAVDLKRIAITAVKWHMSGNDADQALAMWTGKAQDQPATHSGAAGGAARTTKRRASTPGTTTRPKRTKQTSLGPTSGNALT